jgi:hypothetical protein
MEKKAKGQRAASLACRVYDLYSSEHINNKVKRYLF